MKKIEDMENFKNTKGLIETESCKSIENLEYNENNDLNTFS
jgi:hypothetical protein